MKTLTFTQIKELLTNGVNRELIAKYSETALDLFTDFEADGIKEIIENIDNGCDDFEVGDFRFLSADEADKAAKEYIKDSVWAFNADFIIAHSSALDYDAASKKIISAIQNECESGNDAMLKLIDDFDDFADDAISCDGRGHFLSSYDSYERELINKELAKDYFYYKN